MSFESKQQFLGSSSKLMKKVQLPCRQCNRDLGYPFENWGAILFCLWKTFLGKSSQILHSPFVFTTENDFWNHPRILFVEKCLNNSILHFFSPVILIQVLNGKHHKNFKQSMLFRNFVMLAFICLVKKSTMTSDAYKSIYLLVFIFKNRVNHLVQNNQSTNFQFSLWCGFSGVCIFVIHSARSDCTTDILN